MRRKIDLSHKCQPIKAGRFTFRTLNPPRGRLDRKFASLDKLITVSLPAIDGEKHKFKNVRLIEL